MVLSIPHYFVAGTKAKAGEVNANFTACKDAINSNESVISQKLDKNGGTLSGAIDMSEHKINNLGEPVQDADAATKSYVDTGVNAVIPTGSVFWFAMNAAPTGFLKCDGSAVSRTTYANLFSSIGTIFGVGDSSTTFNLPDLRGEFVRGFDDGRGVDTGRTFGSSQTDETKAHNHLMFANVSINGGTWPTATTQVATETITGSEQRYTMAQTNSAANIGRSGNTGGTETRPRNVALLACIKY